MKECFVINSRHRHTHIHTLIPLYQSGLTGLRLRQSLLTPIQSVEAGNEYCQSWHNNLPLWAWTLESERESECVGLRRADPDSAADWRSDLTSLV